MRATRVGGSLSSSARAFGATRQVRPVIQNRRAAPRAIAVQSKPFLPIHFAAFMTNPLSSVGTLAASRPPKYTAQPIGAIQLITPMDVKHQGGKEVAIQSAFCWIGQA